MKLPAASCGVSARDSLRSSLVCCDASIGECTLLGFKQEFLCSSRPSPSHHPAPLPAACNPIFYDNPNPVILQPVLIPQGFYLRQSFLAAVLQPPPNSPEAPLSIRSYLHSRSPPSESSRNSRFR